MVINEAKGRSISRQLKREEGGKELHHLRIYAHPEGTPQSPAWVVEHHAEIEDPSPTNYEIGDGHALLRHVATHANVPDGGGD